VPIALTALLLFGLLYATWRVRYRYPPRRLPQVLCFHKISRRFRWEGTWTTPERFTACVDSLVERGYTFVGEDDYLAALDAPDEDHSRKLFLTFDDGYEEIHGDAWPVLTERAIPFHVFLISDYMGRDNGWDLSLGRRPCRHLSWEQARELAAAGVTFGSHTRNHRDLTRTSSTELADELRGSRSTIETELGCVVKTVSYPFGRYNAVVLREAELAGYTAGFSLYPPRSNEVVERMALRRNGVYVIDSVAAVATKLAAGDGFWFEEMKCRTINAIAALTPMLKRFSR